MDVHTPSVGIDHPTVVPANLDPDRSGSAVSDDTESTADVTTNGGSVEPSPEDT